MNDFDKCTTTLVYIDTGKTTVICKLNLWSVQAETRESAMREAMHYFRQYKSDGEYPSIIGGNTPLEILIND